MKRITTVILYILYIFHIVAQNKSETDSICAMWVNMDIPHYGVRLHPIVKDKESLNDCLKSRVFYCQQSDDTLFVVSDTDIIFNNKLCNIKNNWELKQVFINADILYVNSLSKILVSNNSDSLLYINLPEIGSYISLLDEEKNYSPNINYRLVSGKMSNYQGISDIFTTKFIDDLLVKLNIENLYNNNITKIIIIHPKWIKNLWCKKYMDNFNNNSYGFDFVLMEAKKSNITSIYFTTFNHFDVFGIENLFIETSIPQKNSILLKPSIIEPPIEE